MVLASCLLSVVCHLAKRGSRWRLTSTLLVYEDVRSGKVGRGRGRGRGERVGRDRGRDRGMDRDRGSHRSPKNWACWGDTCT